MKLNNFSKIPYQIFLGVHNTCDEHNTEISDCLPCIAVFFVVSNPASRSVIIQETLEQKDYQQMIRCFPGAIFSFFDKPKICQVEMLKYLVTLELSVQCKELSLTQ